MEISDAVGRNGEDTHRSHDDFELKKKEEKQKWFASNGDIQ